MERIREKIVSACIWTQLGMELISDPEVYTGEAQEEISLFFASMLNHLQRMETFYQTAEIYLCQTYMEYYRNDLQLAEWIAKEMGQE